MRLVPSSDGRVVLDGQDITSMSNAHAQVRAQEHADDLPGSHMARSTRATTSVPSSANRSASRAGRAVTFAIVSPS